MQSETDPPRIGFAIIDNGEDEAEVFLSNDNIRLRIKHPIIAAYFAQYFEIVWSRAKKLKTGSVVNKELLEELEIQLAQQNSQ